MYFFAKRVFVCVLYTYMYVYMYVCVCINVCGLHMLMENRTVLVESDGGEQLV